MATERTIGQAWWNALEESMKVAAEEEKRQAIEQGSIHEGVLADLLLLMGDGANVHTNTHIQCEVRCRHYHW